MRCIFILYEVKQQKTNVHISNWMRNLTGSQCNDINMGMERLKRGALVTILARQFWTPCNFERSFPGWNIIIVETYNRPVY